MTGFLSSENWISELPARVRSAVETRMITIEVPAGATFRRTGETADGLFQVQKGYLRLLGLHSDGRQILILIYRDGNTFGETAVVAKRPLNHTTVALTDTRVNQVPLADFWDLYRTHPEIPESLCRKFAHNISKSFVRRELRATLRLRGQIAKMFTNIAEFCGEPAGAGWLRCSLPITHTDIAEHLEVTRQAVQREMSAMSDAGVLQKRGGHWYLRAGELERESLLEPIACSAL
ncbi:MAG TPA: Crp/Fnr family transcriptional regulator [Steroidobacter sp.]|uniref:Crp/Fnr family transcriptional regulator n=1 Tax=Steroidobacter sp. TaxID=1978227 RepID=UPI002EDAD562